MRYNWQLILCRVLKKRNKIKIGIDIQRYKFLPSFLFCQKKSKELLCSFIWKMAFPYIINLHEILMELTVATKHLKIRKCQPKLCSTSHLCHKIVLPAAYCHLSWLLSEELSFKIRKQLGIIQMQLNFSPGSEQCYSHHRFIGGLSEHKYINYFLWNKCLSLSNEPLQASAWRKHLSWICYVIRRKYSSGLVTPSTFYLGSF